MKFLIKYRPVYLLLSVLIPLSLCFSTAFGQSKMNVDSIYFHLYTDSLKKGTFNYINVDGLLSDGKYTPLDSSTLAFSTTLGYFKGNSLWIPSNAHIDSAVIQVKLHKDTTVMKCVTLHVKKAEENERLKTVDEIMREINPQHPGTKRESKRERRRNN